MNLKVPLGLLLCVLVGGTPFAAGSNGHGEPKSVTASCALTSADVSWEAPGEGSPVGYDVYKKAAGETYYVKANTALVTATWYVVGQLSSGIAYGFRVTAVYDDGNSSAMSAPAFCTTG
jgi:hypothetical protein